MSGSREARGIVAGALLLVLLHAVYFAIAIPLGGYIGDQLGQGPYGGLMGVILVIASIGVAQLLYALPLALWLKRKRKRSMMKGVIAMGVITALINGGCFLVMVS